MGVKWVSDRKRIVRSEKMMEKHITILFFIFWSSGCCKKDVTL